MSHSEELLHHTALSWWDWDSNGTQWTGMTRQRDRRHHSWGWNTLVPCQYAQITVTACLFRTSCFRRLSSVRACRDVVGVSWDRLRVWRENEGNVIKRAVGERREKWKLCDQQNKVGLKRKQRQYSGRASLKNLWDTFGSLGRNSRQVFNRKMDLNPVKNPSRARCHKQHLPPWLQYLCAVPVSCDGGHCLFAPLVVFQLSQEFAGLVEHETWKPFNTGSLSQSGMSWGSCSPAIL